MGNVEKISPNKFTWDKYGGRFFSVGGLFEISPKFPLIPKKGSLYWAIAMPIVCLMNRENLELLLWSGTKMIRRNIGYTGMV